MKDEADTEEHILLFLHIPKCGGATLSTIVCDNYAETPATPELDGMFFGGVYYFPGAGFFKPEDLSLPPGVELALHRSDLRAVVGHFWYGIHRFISRPCKYVTLLRHPVTRIWSLYNHLSLRGYMSIERFVLDPPYREIDNDQTRRLAGIEPKVGQCDRHVFERALENLTENFAVVGLTERFDESVAVMKETLGWTKPIVYYPRNVNISVPEDDGPPDSAIALIEEVNAWDLQLYDRASTLLAYQLDSHKREISRDLQAIRALKAKWRSKGERIP